MQLQGSFNIMQCIVEALVQQIVMFLKFVYDIENSRHVISL